MRKLKRIRDINYRDGAVIKLMIFILSAVVCLISMYFTKSFFLGLSMGFVIYSGVFVTAAVCYAIYESISLEIFELFRDIRDFISESRDVLSKEVDDDKP